ncbi:serine protease inhibitor A3N-like isoform X2 [Paroedura picta]|uniref:serine protease inhibitor A3N-like isoform X2 n=1 Tax=Paroedura picta TaxID=143630 RepID=UPI004056AD82
MTYLFLLLIGLQFHCYHLQDIQECRIGDDVMSMIINSNADFAFRLYKEMSSTQDFQDSTRAKQQINDYLTTKTSGKTVNIVKDLSEQTSMVLVNYIFFKGDWKLRFHPKLTYEGDFLSYGNTYVKLSMMKKTSSYGYFHDEDLSCTVVRIPYTDNAEAWFILPDEGKLNDVVSSLEKEDLDNWRGSFEYRDIDLRIPKFSISASTDVTDLLQSLGVTNADLSEITRDHDLRFSQAFHEAVLDLHEDHTLLDQPGAGVFRGAQLLIEFNRPFLIVTLDTSTGTILLMGKILNPNEE